MKQGLRTVIGSGHGGTLRRWLWTCGALVALVLPAAAWAETTIWHYDQLPADMNDVATGLKQHPMHAHPGFVKGEAWGQVYKPKPEDYPVKINSVEFVMTQPPNVSGVQSGNFSIEIYNSASAGPDPQSNPVFSVTTQDFANGGQIGQPVQGNTGMIYQFDYSKPENHPPEITSGNIFVVLRYLDDTADMSAEWGKTECMKIDLGPGLAACGCQKLAALTDDATTNGANLMHIVWPVGTCSGNKAWKFVEQISTATLQMKGDFILRLGVDTAGSSGGGGGTTDAGSTANPDASIVATKLEVSSVTPSASAADKVVKVDVYGKGFAKGLTAKLGANDIAVDAATVTPVSFSATVGGLAAGDYDLIVKNPNGEVAFLTKAFTVKAASAGVDAGGSDTGAVSGAPFELGTVTPACIPAGTDSQITVMGNGFVAGMTMTLGGVELLAIDVQSPYKAVALAPKGIAAGQQSLIAKVPGGQTKALANAVTVGACGPVGPSSSSGCSSTPAGEAPAGAWAILAALVAALAWRRRVA